MIKYIYTYLICFLAFNSIDSFAQSQNNINIYWDSSLSMQQKDIKNELLLLDTYFQQILNTEISLVVFSNSLNYQQVYKMENGNWLSLKETLLNTIYDGMVSYDILLPDQQSSINLLFTDGLEVIDKLVINTEIPTFIISSTKKVNESLLKVQSLKSGGNFINLNEQSIKEGLALLNFKKNKVVKAKLNEASTKKLPNIKPIIKKGYVSGSVYGAEGVLEGATIINKNKTIGSVTNIEGKFSIKANNNDVLVISYLGKKTKEVIVEASQNIEILLLTDENELDEVVVTGKAKQEPEMVETGYGKVNKEKLGYAVKTISAEEVMSGNATNLSDALRRKMGATKYTENMDISLTVFRNETAGVLQPSAGISPFALIVIDGMPLPRSTLKGIREKTNKLVDFIDPNNVASVTVLKGLAATNRYGSEGAGGVILITTKTSLGGKKTKTPYNSALLRNNDYTENLKQVNNSIKDISYIKPFETYETLDQVYSHYLKQRLNYLNDPLYFANVSDYIAQWGNKELASKIRSNILEINPKEANALRFVAYKATQQKDVFFAKRIYEKIAQLKPNEAQSYRDLALIYQETGYYQKALDIYNNIQNNSYPNVNFSGLKKVINNEMKRLILLHKNKLNVTGIPTKYLNIKKIACDARIVFEWNDRMAEFDLQFVNPQKKFFTWSHTNAENAVRLLKERTQGFNTEEFLLIAAEKGEWLINVEPKLQGKKTPMVLKYTVYKNYGKPNETKTSKVLILNNIKGKQMLGKIVI